MGEKLYTSYIFYMDTMSEKCGNLYKMIIKWEIKYVYHNNKKINLYAFFVRILIE